MSISAAELRSLVDSWAHHAPGARLAGAYALVAWVEKKEALTPQAPKPSRVISPVAVAVEALADDRTNDERRNQPTSAGIAEDDGSSG